jgi:ribosomal protein S18 acetylase RimI-like enzyme
MNLIECRRLGPVDAPVFATLRLRGLHEHPNAFGEDAAEFVATPIETHRERLAPRPENAVVYGASVGSQLVGIGGLYRRAGRQKTQHRAEVFGMYVKPELRRRGIGQALLQALIQHARGIEGLELLGIGVVTTNTSALHLYERAGFVTWGVEPRALVVGGVYHDITHMDLNLRRKDNSATGNKEDAC